MKLTGLTIVVTLHTDEGTLTETVHRDGQRAANWATVMPACQTAYSVAFRRAEGGQFDQINTVAMPVQWAPGHGSAELAPDWYLSVGPFRAGYVFFHTTWNDWRVRSSQCKPICQGFATLEEAQAALVAAICAPDAGASIVRIGAHA